MSNSYIHTYIHTSNSRSHLTARQEQRRRFGRSMASLASLVLYCTHVQIRAQSVNALIHITRKGSHSINIQVICDAACRIIHVFANYPGSSHDSFILANSTIPAIFEGNPPLDGWLLGDNGYPLKTWLITPFLMPATVRELVFNRKHTQTV